MSWSIENILPRGDKCEKLTYRLVELASHTWNSHYGIQANATGSLLPVYVNRAYFTDHARYETAAEYRERIRLDAVKMTEYLRTKVEVNPHVFVWPYGEANGIAIEELKKLGYDMFFTLESGLANASQLDSIPRVLIANNPSLKEFAANYYRTGRITTTDNAYRS
ncbi:polysaccharide deacetylase family protein [Escherichia coli]